MNVPKLTAGQRELVTELLVILGDDEKNTHQIAQARGDSQGYESYLRDRLFRLAKRGVLCYRNTTKGRFWSLRERVKAGFC